MTSRARAHVERKRHPCVAEQDEQANTMKSVQRVEALGEREDAEVDNGADGSVKVKRDNRVHLPQRSALTKGLSERQALTLSPCKRI